MNDNFQSSQYSESLHKKWSFLLWASLVNVTKFAVTSFFLPLFTNDVTLHVTVMLMSTLFILYFLTKISNINVLSKLLNSLQGYIKWSGCLSTIFKRPPLISLIPTISVEWLPAFMVMKKAPPSSYPIKQR